MRVVDVADSGARLVQVTPSLFVVVHHLLLPHYTQKKLAEISNLSTYPTPAVY